jgi:hypothetical protein
MQKNHDSEHMNCVLASLCSFLANLPKEAFHSVSCAFEFHSQGFHLNQRLLLRRLSSRKPNEMLRLPQSSPPTKKQMSHICPVQPSPFMVHSSILLGFLLRSRKAEGERREGKNDTQLFWPLTSPSRRIGFAGLFSTSKLVMVYELLRRFSEFYPIPALI